LLAFAVAAKPLSFSSLEMERRKPLPNLIRLLLIGAALATPSVGRADAQDAAKPRPIDIPGPVQAFGAQQKSCLEWSDNCVVCQRDADGSVHCSTPSIACLPEPVVCRRQD
jgi:hypothetical protein